VYGVLVEFEGEGLKKGDVVGKYLLIREVQLQYYDTVDVVVGQEIVHGGLIANIFKEDAEGLQQLKAHKAPTVLRECLQKVGLHVLLKEEVKDFGVILVTPDQNFCDGTEGLNNEVLVALCHHWITQQYLMLVLELLQ